MPSSAISNYILSDQFKHYKTACLQFSQKLKFAKKLNCLQFCVVLILRKTWLLDFFIIFSSNLTQLSSVLTYVVESFAVKDDNVNMGNISTEMCVSVPI